jgi:hypothetical protein
MMPMRLKLSEWIFYRGRNNSQPMNKSRLLGRWLALAMLAAAGPLCATAVDASASPAASGSDKPVFTPATTGLVISHENVPNSYELLKEKAPEALVIEATIVKRQLPAATPGETTTPGTLIVTVEATVVSVTRSASKLKAGDKITIYYPYAPEASGAPGPSTIPLVRQGGQYEAYLYLNGGPPPAYYLTDASAESFVELSPDAVAAMLPGGAVANPNFLPTPENPAPVGVIKLVTDSLQKFAEASQTDGHWTVSIASFKDPLPLQTIDNATPVLLSYYLAPTKTTPLTQPTVLVYFAGTQLAHNSATDLVGVERALIIDYKGRLLGNAPWATRPQKDGMLTPLPIWRWTASNLDVEDPTEHDVQHVPLVFNATPKAPEATTATTTVPDTK